MIYIGVDQSKRFSQYTIGDERGKIFKRTRIANESKEIRNLMESLPEGPKIAALEEPPVPGAGSMMSWRSIRRRRSWGIPWK